MTHVRPYEPRDAEPTHEVFRAAVTGTAARHYTPEQIEAWCPSEYDLLAWAERRSCAWTLVAERSGRVVGFADLTDGGVLDMLFVHPDAGRAESPGPWSSACSRKRGGAGSAE